MDYGNRVVLDRSDLLEIISDGIKLDSVSIVYMDLSGYNFRNAKFYNVHFINVNFHGADLSYAEFSGCRFESIIFECTCLYGSVFSECSFYRGSMLVSNMGKSVIDTCLFSGSHLGSLNVVGLSLRNTRFMDSCLNSVCFTNCHLEKVDFEKAYVNDCHVIEGILKGLNIIDSLVENLELSQLSLNGISIDNTSLCGTILIKRGRVVDCNFSYCKIHTLVLQYTKFINTHNDGILSIDNRMYLGCVGLANTE